MSEIPQFVKTLQQLNSRDWVHVTVSFSGSWGTVRYRTPLTEGHTGEKEFENWDEMLDILDRLLGEVKDVN